MVMKISLDTIFHYTKISLTYWLYFPNYVSYLWLIYFPIGSLYLLISLPHFFPPQLPPSSCNHLCVLCNYNCFYFITFIFFLDSIYKWNHTVFVFVWLISLSVIPLLIHPCCHRWQDFILFYGWVTFHCVYIPSFL